MNKRNQARAQLIYVAGPYTAPTKWGTLKNVQRAIDAALALFEKGHSPYVPHLTHYIDERAKANKIPLKWKDYIRWDMPWLERCDGLLFLGSSKGATLELRRAKSLGKKVYYSIDDVPIVSDRRKTK